jgi:uncharacterized membrane protein YdbT with pleckstrin-like domain
MDKNIKTRKSAMVIVFKVFRLSVLFNIIYTVISLVADNVETFNSTEWKGFGYDTLLLIWLVILQILIIWFFILKQFNEYYILDNKYIIHKKWIFTKTEHRYNTERIRSINVHKSFYGNLMEYGDIIIAYSEANSPKVTFENISSPEQFIYFIEEMSKNSPAIR